MSAEYPKSARIFLKEYSEGEMCFLMIEDRRMQFLFLKIKIKVMKCLLFCRCVLHKYTKMG
jgi:hypothetical protein